MNEQRTALVTGGTGFIGSNLIKKLISTGWIVHAIVRQKSDLKALAICVDKITLHEHDGSTESLVKIFAASKPDVVFHLASLFLSGHTPKDVAQLIQSNVLFSTQLVEAMNENGVKNLVNTGTSWQHYENKDYSPVNLYAATKQAFEAILQYYVEAKSFKAITLKLFDTYGPDDTRTKLFHLLEQVAKSQEPLAMSPGEQLIDLVHVDDVIEAYLIAAERLLCGLVSSHECYTVSTGSPVSLKDLVRIYEEVTKIKIRIQWGGRPYRTREVMMPWLLNQSLHGWQPKISLHVGMQNMASRRMGNAMQWQEDVIDNTSKQI